jgi:hypothetical protein
MTVLITEPGNAARHDASGDEPGNAILKPDDDGFEEQIAFSESYGFLSEKVIPVETVHKLGAGGFGATK